MSGTDCGHPPPIIDLECGQFSTTEPKQLDKSAQRQDKHSKGSVRLALPNEEADDDDVCSSTANASTCQQSAQSQKASVSKFTPLDQSKASKKGKGKQAASASTSPLQKSSDGQPSTANVHPPGNSPSLNSHSNNRPNGPCSPHRTPPGALREDADEPCQWAGAPTNNPDSQLVTTTDALSARDENILAPNVCHALDYAQIEQKVVRLWDTVARFSRSYEHLKNEFRQVKEKLCVDVKDATRGAVTRGTTYVQGFGTAHKRSFAAQEASREAMEMAHRALLQSSSMQMHMNSVSQKAESQAMGIRSKMEGIEHRSCETESSVEKLAQDMRRIEEQSNEHNKKSLELLDEVEQKLDLYKSDMRKELAAVERKMNKFIATTKASEKQHSRSMQDVKDKCEQLHRETKSNLEQIEGKFDTKLGEFETELKEKLVHVANDIEYHLVDIWEKQYKCIAIAGADVNAIRVLFRHFRKKICSDGGKTNLQEWKERLWPTVDTGSTVSDLAESSTQAQERESKKRKRNKSASSSSRRKRQRDIEIRITPPEE